MGRALWAGTVALALMGCAGGTSGSATPTPPSTSTTTSTTTAPAPLQARAKAPMEERLEQAGLCAAEPPEGPIRLVLWHLLGGDAAPAALDRQVAAFRAEHPDVDVVVEQRTGTAEEMVAAVADLPADERPDAILGGSGAVRAQADSGLFVDPSECTGDIRPPVLASLLPGLAHHYTVAGRLRAAPYNVSVPLLMFDRVRWRAAGLDPDDPPTTFDELLAAADQLVDSGAAATGLALYDRSANWLVAQTAAREGRLLIEPNNGHDGVSIEAIEFEHPGVVELLTALHERRASGRLLWQRENRGGTDDLLALVDAETPTGMTLHTSAALGDVYAFIEAAGYDHIEVGAAPMPAGWGAHPAPLGGQLGGGAWWLVDRNDPQRVAATWQVVEWLVRPDSVADLAAATGYVPTSPAAAERAPVQAAWAEHPEMRAAYDVAVAVRAEPASSWQVGFEPQIQRQLELAVAYPIDAGSDPTTALREHEALALDWAQKYELLVTGG